MKDISYTFEPHVYNDCHVMLMMACEFKNIAILNLKDINYRCVLWNMAKTEAINMLGNFEFENKGVL